MTINNVILFTVPIIILVGVGGKRYGEGMSNHVEIFSPTGATAVVCDSSYPDLTVINHAAPTVSLALCDGDGNTTDVKVEYHSSSLTQEGHLLACGGLLCNEPEPTDHCFRLENGTWKISTPLPARLFYGALVDLSGTMAWFGGQSETMETVNQVFTMSLEGEWTTAKPMLTKRQLFCVLVFNETVAIIIGMK